MMKKKLLINFIMTIRWCNDDKLKKNNWIVQQTQKNTEVDLIVRENEWSNKKNKKKKNLILLQYN